MFEFIKTNLNNKSNCRNKYFLDNIIVNDILYSDYILEALTVNFLSRKELYLLCRYLYLTATEWEHISTYQNISIDFAKSFCDKLNWSIIMERNLFTNKQMVESGLDLLLDKRFKYDLC